MKRVKGYGPEEADWEPCTAIAPEAIGRRRFGSYNIRNRVGMRCMVAGLFGTFVILPCFYLYFPKAYRNEGRESKSTLDQSESDLGNVNFDMANPVKLKNHVIELSRIKTSVLNELRSMEERYHTIKASIDAETVKLSEVQRAVELKSQQLELLERQVDAERQSHRENVEANIPSIWAPAKLAEQLGGQEAMLYYRDGFESTGFKEGFQKLYSLNTGCCMETCFDYSKCSLILPFKFYLYEDARLHHVDVMNSDIFSLDTKYRTRSRDACLFVLWIDVLVVLKEFGLAGVNEFEKHIHSLQYWRDEGRNHLVYFQLPTVGGLPVKDAITFAYSLRYLDWGKAMIAAPFAVKLEHVEVFRSIFDIVVPIAGSTANDFEFPAPLVPIRRSFLAHFSGMRMGTDARLDFFEQQLRRIQEENESTDRFLFDFTCSNKDSSLEVVRHDQFGASDGEPQPSELDSSRLTGGDWFICEQTEADAAYRNATFGIVPLTNNSAISISPTVARRLSAALEAGVVPVVVGDFAVPLPFHEFVDWSMIAIRLPYARLPEMHFLLRTFGDSDLAEMKRRGRLIYDAYFSSHAKIVETVLASVRSRLQIPAAPVRGCPSPMFYNGSNPMTVTEMPYVPAIDEYIGPIELPYDSPTYGANYSFAMTKRHFLWNDIAAPDDLFPFLPFDTVLPTEAKFDGSSTGFRPIAKGTGGSGKEYSEALGGNHPREQFTIVLLTYERESVLIESLQTLNNLPYLNKIVVVWNSVNRPRSDLKWPKLSVPLQVVFPGKNSLNNRFLPFDCIDTEAVLSLDDDAHLRHDEIVFGFRVWRDNRDEIVGFPGRFHAWDSLNRGWLYNSNHSCELSMVLTGAAFYHKYYAYQYSSKMPAVIRDKVDLLMNCEDIAMNFLVSHLTRKPPLKVTSRWTFRCPGCPETLSSDESHFRERHECIQFFTKVYGYNPLLNSQFRLDSVLFKTRLPHNHQKCFKFI